MGTTNRRDSSPAYTAKYPLGTPPPSAAAAAGCSSSDCWRPASSRAAAPRPSSLFAFFLAFGDVAVAALVDRK